MATNMAITLEDALHGGAPLTEGRNLKEWIKIVGTATAVDDDGVYTVRWCTRDPIVLGWPGTQSYNSSTKVLTLVAKFALASGTAYFAIVDRVKGPV